MKPCTSASTRQKTASASSNWNKNLPPPPLLLPEVIVYGTVCLDRFIAVTATGEPRSGGGANNALQEMPGGEAFNTATALAGWGTRVLLTGTAIGSDSEGDRLRHLLDTHPLGMPRGYLPDVPAAVTPVCTVRVFPDGERHMSGKGFASAAAPPPLPLSLLQSRPLFICDPNLGPPAVTAVIAAHDAGCAIVAMDFAQAPEVVGRSRILVTSIEMLARQGETRTPEITVRELVQAGGAQTAIVTKGRDGCVVFDRDKGLFQQPAARIDEVTDTTGAGDVFRAGLAWGLLRFPALPDMVRFATAAAGEHCRVWGGGSRPSLAVVSELASHL